MWKNITTVPIISFAITVGFILGSLTMYLNLNKPETKSLVLIPLIYNAKIKYPGFYGNCRGELKSVRDGMKGKDFYCVIDLSCETKTSIGSTTEFLQITTECSKLVEDKS